MGCKTKVMSMSIILALLASLIVPAAVASSSTQESSVAVVNQLRNEALMVKIVLQKILEVYKVPPSIEKKAEKLISMNIYNMTEAQLQQYINNGTLLIEQIEKIGVQTNVVKSSKVIEHIVNVTIVRSIEIAHKLNISINVSVIKSVLSSVNITRYHEIISTISVQITPKLIEVLVTKLVAIANEATQNLSIHNLKNVEKKLSDIMKMMKIINESVEHMHAKTMAKNVVKELEKLMKKLENASKEIHEAMNKVKVFRCRMRKEYTKKLMMLETKIKRMLNIINRYKNLVVNTSIEKTIDNIVTVLKKDLELIENVSNGNVSLDKLVEVAKKVEHDVAKAEKIVMQLMRIVKEKLESEAKDLYAKAKVVISKDLELVKEIYNASTTLNASKLADIVEQFNRTLRSIATDIDKCMELANATDKMQCLNNTIARLTNVSTSILKMQLALMKNMSAELLNVSTSLSSVANITKNVTSMMTSMIKRWNTKMKSFEMRIAEMLKRVAEEKNVSKRVGKLIEALTIAQASMKNVVLKIVDEMKPLKIYVNIVVKVEKLGKEFEKLVKEAQEKKVSAMVSKLINEIKSVLKEIVKYLTNVYENMKKFRCSNAMENLSYVKKLVEKLENLIKELEQLLQQSSGSSHGYSIALNA